MSARCRSALAFAVAAVTAAIAVAACENTVITGCRVDGVLYPPGASFPAPDGCNSCTCGADGEAACTAMGCAGCSYGGAQYAIGATFPALDGCNTCSCEPGGVVACTEMACAGCSYGGVSYQVGDVFPGSEPCSTCTCLASGSVSCEAPACSVGCAYGGPGFALGDVVPAGDGCNSCTCGNGGFGCTEIACACNPASEFGRQYVGNSPGECALIDFACSDGTSYFANDCGCGCEQPLYCPAVFDCMPGGQPACDTAALAALCPFSVFAL